MPRTRSSRAKVAARKEPSPEPFYEVETIEKAKWKEGEWLYFVKWAGYDETDNTWEPGYSLNYCSWMLGKFWRDVGMNNFDMVPERAEGFELASSANFRDLCKTRLEQQEELYDTEIDPLYTDTLELDGGQTCLIPDPKLLWTNPECLGLKGLTANDRYQIVCRSLESKKIDASQILYKKVRKDTREDSGWLDNWKAGCVICADPEKPLSGLLACRCRFKAYCLECLRSLEESHEAGNDLREGRISCPTCRDLVYIISSSWVMLTQEEKAARLKKRSVEKIEKRRLNKLNKQLKKHVFGSDKPEDYDQGAASSSTPIGVHVMIGADRASHIKQQVMSLFSALDSTSPTEKIVNIYRAQYPSCDATDEEILARWST